MLVGVAALALWAALGVAHVTRPPGYFTKYTTAAARSDAELGARALDLSPLYLAFTRAVAAHGGATAVLRAQAMLHAATAVLVAATVALGAGLAWGVAAGAAAALYRPFLVYAGVLEPECLLLVVLAAALLLGELARRVADERSGRALAFGAGAVLGCAALGRPQWLLLAPLWALAVAAGRRRRRVWAAATVIGGAALVVVAFLAQRVAAFGVPVIMNPGPVLYEGNRPGVLGAVGDAPELVKLAEAGVAGEADYAHVVYRTVAAAALGSQPDAAAANRYWSSLAWEHVRAHPAEAVRTIARKAVLSLGPYELHDLPEAEEADRRLRRVLPWGFGVLLALAAAARRCVAGTGRDAGGAARASRAGAGHPGGVLRFRAAAVAARTRAAGCGAARAAQTGGRGAGPATDRDRRRGRALRGGDVGRGAGGGAARGRNEPRPRSASRRRR